MPKFLSDLSIEHNRYLKIRDGANPKDGVALHQIPATLSTDWLPAPGAGAVVPVDRGDLSALPPSSQNVGDTYRVTRTFTSADFVAAGRPANFGYADARTGQRVQWNGKEWILAMDCRYTVINNGMVIGYGGYSVQANCHDSAFTFTAPVPGMVKVPGVYRRVGTFVYDNWDQSTEGHLELHWANGKSLLKCIRNTIAGNTYVEMRGGSGLFGSAGILLFQFAYPKG